jgi:hypothetical protein
MKKTSKTLEITALILIVLCVIFYYVLNEKTVIEYGYSGHQFRVNELGLNCYYSDWGWKKINKPTLHVDTSTIKYVNVADDANSNLNKNNTFYNGDYLKDKNNVYHVDYHCVGGIVTGADPNTFEALGFSYAKDKNNVYFAGKNISVDYDSFRVLPNGVYFAIDKTAAYYGGMKISGVDLNTFHPITRQISADKNCIYFEDRIKTDQSGKCVNSSIINKYCGINIKEEDCWSAILQN